MIDKERFILMSEYASNDNAIKTLDATHDWSIRLNKTYNYYSISNQYNVLKDSSRFDKIHHHEDSLEKT